MTQIEDDEPITNDHTTEVIRFLQYGVLKEFTMGLIKHSTYRKENIDLQLTFDQMESSKHEFNKFYDLDLNPSSNYLVALPISIKVPRDVAHMLKDTQHHLWVTLIYE